MRFEILLGPEDGRVVTFSKETIAIGRNVSENDFAFVCDPMLSKRHAVVSREGESFRVADVGNEGKGSRHGTYLKNRHLKEKDHLTGEGAALEEGDILIVGKTWVRFLGE